MLVVTEFLNIAINDFDAKKFARKNWVLVVTELVISRWKLVEISLCRGRGRGDVERFLFTARKRSLGQGNMFTGVCLSTGGMHGPGVHGPGVCVWRRPPPPTATGAGGTHPTGMHSCLKNKTWLSFFQRNPGSAICPDFMTCQTLPVWNIFIVKNEGLDV